MDDVLGHTGDWNEHMKVLKDFFERVQKANLSLKPSKCKLALLRSIFLGKPFKRTQLDHREKLLVAFWTTTDQKQRKRVEVCWE